MKLAVRSRTRGAMSAAGAINPPYPSVREYLPSTYICLFRYPTLNLTDTHTHLFNGPFSRTTQVSRYEKGKTNWDFTDARDSEWQWHQLGHMQVCTSLQADNHTSSLPLSFLQAGCPSCRPTNSVKALKATDPKPNLTLNPNHYSSSVPNKPNAPNTKRLFTTHELHQTQLSFSSERVRSNESVHARELTEH